MNRFKLSPLFLALAAICLVFMWGFTELSLYQIRSGYPALDELRPLVSLIVKSYAHFEFQPRLYYDKVLPVVAGLWCLCAIIGILRRDWRIVATCVLLLMPMLAEGAVLLKYVQLGIFLHCIGFLVLVPLYRWCKGIDRQDERDLPWRWGEIVLFSLLFFVLCLHRYYLIDRVPMGWDTEMCGDRHIFFRSLFGALLHEAGWNPKSTIGALWLALHALMGHLDEPDFYYVYIRLLGVGIHLVKFLVVFCCTRDLFGRLPAFLSVVLLGFGPPEDWWSREPSFHHLPGLIAVLIFWATAKAVERRRVWDFALVSLLTAFARMAYASGIFLAFAPLSFFTLLLVFRWAEWKRHLGKISILLIGLGFWLLWRSIAYWLVFDQWHWLSPIEIPSHTRLPGGFLGKLHTLIVVNGLEVLSTIFLHQVNPTHWTVALTTEPARSVTSVALVLSILGVARALSARGGYLAILLVTCIGWAIFSGITTQVADRRVGTLFVFLNILAAREAGLLLGYIRMGGAVRFARFVGGLFVFLVFIHLGLMSAAFRFKVEAVPHQVIRSRLLREFLEPNTLYVQLVIDHGCNAFYGVYRQLKSCQMGWVQPDFDGPFSVANTIANPAINPKSWVYRETELSACLGSYPERWDNIVFLLIEGADTPNVLQELQLRYPDGVLERKEYVAPDGNKFIVSGYKIHQSGTSG